MVDRPHHPPPRRNPDVPLRQEAFLAVIRAETELRDAMDQVFKAYGLSLTQYNVLRVLRGAGIDGLCRNEIRDRLVTRMPDVTRLLDRMEEAGLVERTRSTDDRRLVNTQLTARGRDLVDSLDGPVAAEHDRQFRHLSRDQLRTIIDLLTLVRAP